MRGDATYRGLVCGARLGGGRVRKGERVGGRALLFGQLAARAIDIGTRLGDLQAPAGQSRNNKQMSKLNEKH